MTALPSLGEEIRNLETSPWFERFEWLITDKVLFSVAGTPVTAATLFTFLLIVAFTFLASALAQRALVRYFRLRSIDNAGTLGVARRLLHYAVMLVGLGAAAETIGIDLGTLFAAGALFAVAIGFAMQNIVQNFVSGVILLLERAIKPGDVLEVETRVVRVVSMGIRATVVRTRDEEEMIVPNTVLVQSTVKNFTLKDSMFRVRTAVGVTYSSDMAEVQDVLQTVADAQEWRLPEIAPRVRLLNFADSSVIFEILLWTDDPWGAQQHQAELNAELWWALKRHGIVIAFPQLDLHFDPQALAMLRQPLSEPRALSTSADDSPQGEHDS